MAGGADHDGDGGRSMGWFAPDVVAKMGESSSSIVGGGIVTEVVLR